MDSVRKYARIILNIVIPLLWIGLVCFLGPKLLRFFLPFVIGWIIAMIANPLVRFLESKVKIVRRHSSMIIIVAVLALIIGLGYFVISRLWMQALSLARELPELYNISVSETEKIFARFENLFRMLPDSMQLEWQKITGSIGEFFSLLVQKIASPTVEVAGSVAKGIPNALVNVVVTILSSYFFIAERDQVLKFGKRYFPEEGIRYCQYLKNDIKRLVGGYFLAQFKIMFVMAVILLAGFLILGVRYAFLLAILVAVLDFLPLFGTGTVLIPWAVFKLLAGEYALAAGLGLLYVLGQVVRQVIQPKIVGDSMGVPPLMTLVFLYLGFKLHGISGMILAVPAGIIVMKLLEYGMFDSMIGNMKALAREINAFRREGDDADAGQKPDRGCGKTDCHDEANKF